MNDPQFDDLPTTPQTPEPRTKSSFTGSILKKFGLIFFIFIVLQIPLMMITHIMEERQVYNDSFPQQFKGYGAKEQTIVGPVLTVPYKWTNIEEKEVSTSDDDKTNSTATKTVKTTKTETGYAHFFPEVLNVTGTLNPELRDEGKFKSILYSGQIDFKGNFNTNECVKNKIDPKDLDWDDAFITLAISDLRGIRKATTLKWNGKLYKFSPGVNGLKLMNSGEFVSLDDSLAPPSQHFDFTLDINGSKSLNIFPGGKENDITLSSTWNDPAFIGGFLPTKKTVNKQGFKANWEVSYFSRNMPQMWTDKDPDLSKSLAQYMVGVTLQTPVEFYRTSIRAVKYGSLFIVMTFLTFFVFELTTKVRIHEIQYLLVGLALCLFFLMLVAISEWLPFALAYLLASVPTIAQITWYTQAFSKAQNNRLWKIMAATLTTLYIYLYVLLQLDNFSLLFGAIGLFIALTVVLYATRNIDWYGSSEPK